MGGESYGRCGLCHTNLTSATPTFYLLVIAGQTKSTPNYSLATPISEPVLHPCTRVIAVRKYASRPPCLMPVVTIPAVGLRLTPICPDLTLPDAVCRRYAVIAAGCASCPRLECGRPGCSASFCYHCQAEWHPNQTCDAARSERLAQFRPSGGQQSPTGSLSGANTNAQPPRTVLDFFSFTGSREKKTMLGYFLPDLSPLVPFTMTRLTVSP